MTVQGAASSSVPAIPTSEERTMSMLSHVLSVVAGFLAPLIIMMTKGNESRFVRDQAVESLNFQITLLIGWMISFVLSFVLIGFLLMPILWIGGLVLAIMGGMKANQGEWYRYPFALRLVK